MRVWPVLVGVALFVCSCSSVPPKEKPKAEQEWHVVRTEEEFLERYRGLSPEYFRPVQQIEMMVKRADDLREVYFREKDVDAGRKARQMYEEAFERAKDIHDATGNDGIISFLMQRVKPQPVSYTHLTLPTTERV